MTDNPAARLRLESFLPYQLSILSNTISSSIAGMYAERFDLGIPEWRVLAIVGRHPGLSAVEVSERSLMDKVAVSRAVAKLIRSGRLQRQFADSDKRRSILELTDHGRDVHAEVAALALDYEKRLLENLDPAELEIFNQVCERLLRGARDLNPPIF